MDPCVPRSRSAVYRHFVVRALSLVRPRGPLDAAWADLRTRTTDEHPAPRTLGRSGEPQAPCPASEFLASLRHGRPRSRRRVAPWWSRIRLASATDSRERPVSREKGRGAVAKHVRPRHASRRGRASRAYRCGARRPSTGSLSRSKPRSSRRCRRLRRSRFTRPMCRCRADHMHAGSSMFRYFRADRRSSLIGALAE